jgi:hypothetical protein
LIASEVRRVKLSFHYDGPKLLRALLATTGFRALDVAANAIRETTNRDRREDLLKVFARIRAPEGAVHMLDLSQSCKAPRIAGEWLQTDVGNAIAGLIPVGAGSGKLAGAATEYLREKKREGHVQLIIAALKSQTTEVAAKIREQVLDRVERVILELTEKTTPRWLASALNASGSLRPLPKSEFVDVARLPPIVVNEGKLERRQTAAVLLALQHATTAERGELITKLKDHAEPDSLDAFAWSLFEQWTAEGGPPKQRWAMMSLGYFGSDAVALRLTPLIRAWPGESQHPRAVAGLECLRAMGTDTALMQLNGMAVKLKFKALQTKAREYMELIAAEKGLTASELEDRIVPDCDLDQRGSRIFDFGSRKFRFVLGSDMKPMLKDDDDKIKSDLPKPSTKDDAAKAAEAINAWKLLKKQVKDVATIQSQRLEQAMVTGRRWSVADFETLLVKHPLMTNLVRLILWAGYDRAGKLVDLFRVTEDQTYANSKDEAYSVNAIAKVGIVHALEINDQQKSPWGEIFSDYELVPPFPQLGRPTYTLDENELRSNTIKRFADVEIPCATLVFGLEKLGWQRGLAQDNGQVNGHSKYFPSADVSAVVIFEDGFPTGYREGWEDQTIADIYFVPAQHRVTWGRRWNNDVTAIPLKKLDLVIVSEVLYDLTALAAKGK